MKVMLLAAGLGERMRPLTDHTPKPLLTVAGTPLLEHHIRRLVAAGLDDLVINVSHLAAQIVDFFGDGSRWGARIAWSHEREPLETAGGIINALPLLGDKPFGLVNGDVWTDYPFKHLCDRVSLPPGGAHLVLVDNPPQHPGGDFELLDSGLVAPLGAGGKGLTYAGLGVYTAAFFAGTAPGKSPMRPLLDRAIARQCLLGEYFPGQWVDVGTPERLQALDSAVRSVAE
ncbi:MAG: nucleotidyltransferase family protein [Halioglobus sp.]